MRLVSNRDDERGTAGEGGRGHQAKHERDLPELDANNAQRHRFGGRGDQPSTSSLASILVLAALAIAGWIMFAIELAH